MHDYAVCGVDCAVCVTRVEGKCEGCRTSGANGDCPFWEGSPCQYYLCAKEKNINNCGQCSEVPCEKLIIFLTENEALSAIEVLKTLS